MTSELGELICDGWEGESVEPALDFLRLRIKRLIFLAVVCDPEDESVSELLELEELLELVSKTSARIPGCASSSTRCCGMLVYKYACDLSWKSR